jgi:hypothetical protein
MTNQEIYDGGEIQSKEYSRRIKDVDFYHYIIFYEGVYYQIEVSDDGINTEVEHPDDAPLVIYTYNINQ